jgi:hypothetical protein
MESLSTGKASYCSSSESRRFWALVENFKKENENTCLIVGLELNLTNTN